MQENETDYTPALRFAWLTPFYDRLMRLMMREAAFRGQLLDLARIESAGDILDLGCGTGSLALLAKARRPEARVLGVDIDEKILGVARAKAETAQADLEFHQTAVSELPFEDDTFDRVLSSLVFHHLDRDAKCAALRESLRVLRPGGEMHIADWGAPGGLHMRIAYLGVQLLDGFETTVDNVRGRIPEFMRDAGFHEVQHTGSFSTLFGTLAFYQGQKRIQT